MTRFNLGLSATIVLVPAALAATACELPAKLGDLPSDAATFGDGSGAGDGGEPTSGGVESGGEVCGEGGPADQLAWSYEREQLPGFVSALATAPGGAVVAVGTQGDATDRDLYIHQYDPAGALVWSQSYGGAAGLSDTPFAVAVDDAGFVHVLVREPLALAPDSQSFDARLVVLRYTPAGALVWRWEHSELLFATDGTYEPIGELAVVGDRLVVLEREPDAPIVRLELDAAGQLVEQVEVAVPVGVHVVLAALGADGSPLLAGGVEPQNLSTPWVGRFTPAGELAWSDQFDDVDDAIHLVRPDGAGGAYITWQRVIEAGQFEYYLRRYGADGAAQWTTLLTESANFFTADAVVRCDGSLLLTGGLERPEPADGALWIARYSADGALQWQNEQTFGFFEGVTLTATPAGDAVVSGNLHEDGPGSSMAPWLARVGVD